MTTLTSPTAVDPRGRFYLRAFAFLAPGLLVWEFAVRSLYPKVQVIWQNGGAAAPDTQWLMAAVGRLADYGGSPPWRL